MRSSLSRTIRPRVFWGTALFGAMLTFVAPALADDAAEPSAKKTGQQGEQPAGLKKAQQGDKPAGLKKAKEAKKFGKPGEKAEGKDKGPGAKKADQKHGPKGQKGTKTAQKKKRHPPVSRKAAINDYKRAMIALKTAEKGASTDKPEDAQKARQQAMKALKRAKRQLRRANRSDAKKLITMSKAERAKIETKLQSRAKKLAEDRKERAEKGEEAIKKELGEKVKLAPVQAELQRHAWRVARLERLIAIAEASGRTQTAVRAKQLLDKENAAHPERLERAAGGGSEASAKTGAPAGPKTNVAAPVAKTAPTPTTTPAPAKEGAQ